MSVPNSTEIDGTVINKGVFSFADLKSNPKLFEITSKYLEGRDIHRYFIDSNQKFVNISKIDEETIRWHQQPKIILQRIVGQNKRKIFATIDLDKTIIFPSANIINANNENHLFTILAILNSDLIDFFYNNFYGESNTNITKSAIESLPCPDITSSQHDLFKEFVEEIVRDTKEKNIGLDKINSLIQDEYSFDKIPTKFGRFNELGWNEFIEEFEKRKITFDIEKKENLHDWFIQKREIIQSFQNRIEVLESRINCEVYKLYNLDSSDIDIIQSNGL